MPMPKRKIGDHLLVKLPGGRMVKRNDLQVSFNDETALIRLWQIVEEGR